MIRIKTEEEIRKMRKAGRAAGTVLQRLEEHIKEGISTEKLNLLCETYTRELGAVSAPLNYKGYPKSTCTSLNDVVCHGIPSDRTILKNGDIINLDITVILDEYHGDISKTYIIGEVPESTRQLVQRTQTALEKGILAVRPDNHFADIGNAIADYLEPFGYGIVRALGGHGIGKSFHEDPFVYHHRQKRKGARLRPGMTFTIEPMINEGGHEVYVDQDDGWTVYTKDGSLSAQFEHTILVTETGSEILTALDR